jgi:hypothetical protein
LATGARRSANAGAVLDAAVHLRPRGPWNATSTEDTIPYEMRCVPAATSEHDVACAGDCSATRRRDVAGVDLEHDEIAVLVGAGHRALLGAPSANVTRVVRSRRL